MRTNRNQLNVSHIRNLPNTQTQTQTEIATIISSNPKPIE